MDNITRLLNEVNSIIKLGEAKNQASGCDFNFISVIDKERSESLHSHIITELIDLNGAHGFGVKFLKMFFETVLCENFCDDAKYFVKKEYYLGAVHIDASKPERSKGGIIDIYIEVGDRKIAIENKIDAPDQPHQLRRYHNFTKHKLYYLTLEGKMPSAQSCCGLKENKDFKRISYQDGILKWLAQCEELASEKSELVVIIRQYMRIVKKITKNMSETEIEIDALLKNSDYLEAAYAISNVIQQRKANEQKSLFNAVMREIGREYGEIFVDSVDGLMKIELGKYKNSVLHWVAGVKNDFFSMITIVGGDKEVCVNFLGVEDPDKRPNIIKFYGKQCGVDFNKLNTVTPDAVKNIAEIAIDRIKIIRERCRLV